MPAGILSQTLRSIGGDKIQIKTEESNVLLEARGTKTLLKAVSHEEFPTLPGVSGGSTLVLARERLLRGIQAVSYAASQSMIRPELGSVFLSMKESGMVCVATDSFRLAEKVVTQTTREDGGEILIPLKHATELVHVLEKIGGDEVELSYDDSQMVVSSGGMRFVSRVIDGNFPNYKEIIPKTFTTEVTMLKGDFAEMLRKARVFSGTEMHVGLHIYPSRKIFSATAQSPNVGEMSDTIEAALSGEDLDINFHIGYLGDCLLSIEGDSVHLGFSGPGRPLIIKSTTDAHYTYLVAPLNR